MIENIPNSSSCTMNRIKFWKSISHAINGILLGWKETNFKIHLLTIVIVLIMAVLFKVELSEFLILLVCIGGVLSAELFNTAIEYIVNFISPEYHIHAKYIKDISAAAVLIPTIFSVIIGLIIFIPKILSFIKNI